MNTNAVSVLTDTEFYSQTKKLGRQALGPVDAIFCHILATDLQSGTAL